MIERLDFGEMTPYNAVEASIHLNRYSIVKPVCKNKIILDAACGEGYGSFFLNKWGAKEVFGLDIDEETIKKADKIFGSSNVKFQCHDVEKLPFPDYYFDIIVSFETLEHIENPDSFLEEIRRVLKPGGMIFLSCPNDPYYYKEGNITNPFHKRPYTFFEFKELAEKHLGNFADYYLGVAVNGFLNMPISKSTEPSDEKPDSMLEMINYAKCDTLCVKQDRYINHWNCNYYLGIWGGNEFQGKLNSVIHPREFFPGFKDEDIELIKEIEKWKKNKEKESIDYKQEKEVEKLKIERQSLMLELLNKEIESLRYSYNIIKQEYEEYRNMTQAVEQEKAYIDAELIGIKKSKGWKLLKFLYKIEGFFRHR